tara:strand:+ start:1701 stop:2630 length:930 start_codon:yes stop_codon:yes gene_type:complete
LEASITFKSIAKKFNEKIILADLSIGVENNSNHVIIGQNGSGKSTILRLLTGLLDKDAGSAYIKGKEISNRSEETKMVTGYMSQIIDLDSEMTIYENLSIYSELYGVSKDNANARIYNFAELFNFKDQLFEKPLKQSTAMLRVIQFSRTLLHDPQILLLDEPTLGMDPQYKTKFWNLIDRIGKDKTILFTTQDFSEAEKFADRISILHNGDIKMDGSFSRLVSATKGLSKFEIRFKETPDESVVDFARQMPQVLKPLINGNSLEFYTHDKKDFFRILKHVIDREISDIDISFCRLLDLYLGIVENGLDS